MIPGDHCWLFASDARVALLTPFPFPHLVSPLSNFLLILIHIILHADAAWPPEQRTGGDPGRGGQSWSS
jgi:hypothetical protein